MKALEKCDVAFTSVTVTGCSDPDRKDVWGSCFRRNAIERAESEKDGYECVVSDDYPPHEGRRREAGR